MDKARDGSNVTVPPPPPPPEPCRKSTNITKNYPVHQNNFLEDTKYFHLNFVFESGFTGDEEVSIVSVYQQCDAIIQSGPTCGLVAMMMAINLVKPKLKLKLEDCLESAKSYGFTKQGEMFSVENFCRFLKEEYGINCERNYDLKKSKLDVLNHIYQGLPVLVPYDAYFNYEPCVKDGQSAHWALICGFAVITKMNQNILTEDNRVNLIDKVQLSSNVTLFQLDRQSTKSTDILKLLENDLTDHQLYVYAREGKSKRVHVWSFDELYRSNSALNEVSKKILNDPDRKNMIYPENGDLKESLSNQFVMIFK